MIFSLFLQVQYLDYGNTECVAFVDLFKYDDRLDGIPYRSALYKLNIDNQGLSKRSYDALKRCMESNWKYKLCQAKIVEERITELKLQNGVNIYQQMRDEVFHFPFLNWFSMEIFEFFYSNFFRFTC